MNTLSTTATHWRPEIPSANLASTGNAHVRTQSLSPTLVLERGDPDPTYVLDATPRGCGGTVRIANQALLPGDICPRTQYSIWGRFWPKTAENDQK